MKARRSDGMEETCTINLNTVDQKTFKPMYPSDCKILQADKAVVTLTLKSGQSRRHRGNRRMF